MTAEQSQQVARFRAYAAELYDEGRATKLETLRGEVRVQAHRAFMAGQSEYSRELWGVVDEMKVKIAALDAQAVAHG